MSGKWRLETAPLADEKQREAHTSIASSHRFCPERVNDFGDMGWGFGVGDSGFSKCGIRFGKVDADLSGQGRWPGLATRSGRYQV